MVRRLRFTGGPPRDFSDPRERLAGRSAERTRITPRSKKGPLRNERRSPVDVYEDSEGDIRHMPAEEAEAG